MTKNTTDGRQEATAATRNISLEIKGIHLKLVNTGKTPATVVSFESLIHMGYINPQKQIILDSAYGGGNDTPPRIFAPGQFWSKDYSGLTMGGTFEKDPVALVLTTVVYKDVWHQPHTTKACFYTHFYSQNQIVYCPDPSSNYMD